MNTDIEYLKQLDADLAEAIERDRSRPETAFGGAGRPRRGGRIWMKVAGAAAAFLVVAGAIGFLAGGGMGMGGADGSGGSAADRFQEVGDAVAGDGGGPIPYASPAPGAPPTDEEGVGTGRGAIGDARDLSKIIRDGRIGVVVPDGSFDDAVGDLTFIAEEEGGFVLASSTRNERSGTFVLRIPASRFDRALGAIRELGQVRFQTVQGEDVTAEFIDFQARLRILQARKAVLLRLFDQADTIPETLQLQSQLDNVQLRIEQIQGQVNFINDQVAESTLRVSIQERNAPATARETDIDNPDLGSAFQLGVQGFLRIVGAVIVGLGYLIPLTILGILVWLVVWFARRRGATT